MSRKIRTLELGLSAVPRRLACTKSHTVTVDNKATVDSIPHVNTSEVAQHSKNMVKTEQIPKAEFQVFF